jgi:hypothetical protein
MHLYGINRCYIEGLTATDNIVKTFTDYNAVIFLNSKINLTTM